MRRGCGSGHTTRTRLAGAIGMNLGMPLKETTRDGFCRGHSISHLSHQQEEASLTHTHTHAYLHRTIEPTLSVNSGDRLKGPHGAKNHVEGVGAWIGGAEIGLQSVHMVQTSFKLVNLRLRTRVNPILINPCSLEGGIPLQKC